MISLQAHCKHMVKLLHHYETPNHRIFLLLEYMRRGRLMDHVMAKRAQWKRLHEAVLNPHPSSSLIKQQEEKDNGVCVCVSIFGLFLTKYHGP